MYIKIFEVMLVQMYTYSYIKTGNLRNVYDVYIIETLLRFYAAFLKKYWNYGLKKELKKITGTLPELLELILLEADQSKAPTI